MASPHLIFLHIEKAAGTSQRLLLYQNYGIHNVFWYGIDSEKTTLDTSEFGDAAVIGGHLDYRFFEPIAKQSLFCSVVRDPIDRAISLFRYIVNTPSQLTAWKRRGFDPKSLQQTLERSQDFRNTVSNTQCHRLGKSQTFSEAMELVYQNNWVLAAYENIAVFNRVLGERLSWKTTSLGRHNVSKRDNDAMDLDSPTAIEQLVDLNIEDLKLHHYLKSSTVFENYVDSTICEQLAWYGDRCTGSPIVDANSAQQISLSVRSQGDAGYLPTVPGTVPLKIQNKSDLPLYARGDAPVLVSFHWLDESGTQVIDFEGNRTRLPRDIPSGTSCEVEAQVDRKEFIKKGIYTLRFSLLQEGLQWFENIARDHPIDVKVTVA